MKTNDQKGQVLERIRENILRRGHHIYVVSGAPTPRFAYSIGLRESVGVELILAGAAFYMKDEVVEILNGIAAQLKAQRYQEVFDVAELGSFTLCDAHGTWTSELLLGAFDYYQRRDIPALQIAPDKTHWTIDVPDMSVPWNASKEPVWRWLHEEWKYPVPANSVGTTNLGTLRGERVTEVMRWEEDEWELFAGAGPDTPREELRVVPLGVLLGKDRSLDPVVNLKIGTGLWRDDTSEWHPWSPSKTG